MNAKQDNGGRVLVVCLPAGGNELRTLRDYIAASLAVGVLALPEGSEVQVLDLPALSGIQVTQAEPVPGMAPEPPVNGAARSGKGAVEKQAVLERMKAYRREHGLGCWDAVAKKTPGVSPEILRDMVTGQSPYPLAIWRKAGAALDKLEQEASHGQ